MSNRAEDMHEGGLNNFCSPDQNVECTDGLWQCTYKTYEQPTGFVNHGWCKFDNMRLQCVGIDDPTGVAAAPNAVTGGGREVYTVSGIRVGCLQRGVNIVRTGGATCKVLVK